MRKASMALAVLAVFLLGLTQVSFAAKKQLTPKEQLGKAIFNDTNLSTPNGQACASCHQDVGFTDPDIFLPVSEGVVPGRVGSRNAPTNKYQRNAPDFVLSPTPTGGQFLDGRALDLIEQAKAPFLNPVEMNNRSKGNVIYDIKRAKYVNLFRQVYGKYILDDTEKAYDAMADAIVAYEKSCELNQFSSKFDAYLAGKAQLTTQEAAGFDLFQTKGKCSGCHSLTPDPGDTAPVFTSRRYFNDGVPKNMSNPFYFTYPEFNPDSRAFIDYGLGGELKIQGYDETIYGPQLGKFKTPTLRNVAYTAPYMHNSSMLTLESVVNFFNTRDVPGAGWGAPEVEANKVTFIGNLGLTDDEEAAIVAFMWTLTDGYF